MWFEIGKKTTYLIHGHIIFFVSRCRRHCTHWRRRIYSSIYIHRILSKTKQYLSFSRSFFFLLRECIFVNNDENRSIKIEKISSGTGTTSNIFSTWNFFFLLFFFSRQIVNYSLINSKVVIVKNFMICWNLSLFGTLERLVFHSLGFSFLLKHFSNFSFVSWSKFVHFRLFLCNFSFRFVSLRFLFLIVECVFFFFSF